MIFPAVPLLHVLQPLEMLLAKQEGDRTDEILYALLSWRIKKSPILHFHLIRHGRELRKVVRFQP